MEAKFVPKLSPNGFGESPYEFWLRELTKCPSVSLIRYQYRIYVFRVRTQNIFLSLTSLNLYILLEISDFLWILGLHKVPHFMETSAAISSVMIVKSQKMFFNVNIDLETDKLIDLPSAIFILLHWCFHSNYNLLQCCLLVHLVVIEIQYVDISFQIIFWTYYFTNYIDVFHWLTHFCVSILGTETPAQIYLISFSVFKILPKWFQSIWRNQNCR